jgi:hypothetical protein
MMWRTMMVALFITVAALRAEDVGQVQRDERISALLRNGKYVEGRFRSWGPAGLELDARNRNEQIQLADVKKVWVEKKSPRWRAALIGAAVGFAAAFPVGACSAGYLADQNNPRLGTRTGFGAGFGLFGAGIGAGIGALTGGTKNVLVYRAGEKP